jgi:hypothetical protein
MMHPEQTRKTLFCQIVGFLMVAITAALMQAGEVKVETSRVLCINVPKLAAGEHDVQFLLFRREGRFHHGYALTPTRDNLPHRVDVTPSPPIQFVNRSGKPIDVEERAIGYYSYKNEHFLKYREQFNKGEIRVECQDALLGQESGADADVTVRVRLVGDIVDEAGAKWPKVAGPERDEAAGAVGSWTAASPWRATAGVGLNNYDEALVGETTLRLGWHKERWAFDPKRNGDQFQGTYTRSGVASGHLHPEVLARHKR